MPSYNSKKGTGDRRTHIVLSLLLVVATLIVFGQVVGHEAITYDDPEYVFDNPNVQHGLTLASVKWAFTATYASNWHPATWLSHMLDYQLYGPDPAGHHATNLLFHTANVLLLFLLLSRMTGAVWKSGFVAALFAVHPLHVESVAWIAERKDVLSAFFWILTMWAYVRYTERPALKRYLAVVVLFALGLMSKPMLVSLPLVFLLLDFWPLARLQLRWKLVLEKVPLAVMSIASSMITFIAQRKGEAVRSLEAFPIVVRLENAVVTYAAYLVKMVLPRGLAVLYPHPQHLLPVWEVSGSVLILIGISVVVFRSAHDRPYLVMGWSWYVITLIPVIGLVQVGVQAMADRYTYLPLIGIFIAVAWGIPVPRPKAQKKGKRQPGLKDSFPLSVSACVVIAVLAGAAYVQTGYWKDSITLYTHALNLTARNYVIQTNLGEALVQQGQPDEGIAHYTEALRIYPEAVKAHTNLGNALLDEGRTDEALQHLSEAVKLNPDSGYEHYNLGNAFGQKQLYGEAIEQYRIAVRLDPELAEAYNNMGTALVADGHRDQAAQYYEQAIRIEPRMVQAYRSLGQLSFDQGDMDKALIWYSKALEIKPEFATLHNDLAAVFYYKGEYAKAWREILLCRNYGGAPSPALLQMLSEKMPEPK